MKKGPPYRRAFLIALQILFVWCKVSTMSKAMSTFAFARSCGLPSLAVLFALASPPGSMVCAAADDTPAPAAAPAALPHLDLHPDPYRPAVGEAATLNITLKTPEGKAMALPKETGLNLFVIRDDLGEIFLEQPQRADDGTFRDPFTFRSGGDWRIFGEIVPDQGSRGLGEEDLAAVARGADARGPHDVEPDVSLVADRRFAGVQAHANPYVGASRPLVLGERALSRDCRGHRLARPRERVEERVSLGVDLAPARCAERLAEDPPVVGDHRAVLVAEVLEQLRRALDVSEQEGDGPGRVGRGHRV